MITDKVKPKYLERHIPQCVLFHHRQSWNWILCLGKNPTCFKYY